MIYTFDFLDDLAINTINEYYSFCKFVDGSLSGSNNRDMKWNEELRDSCHSPDLIEYTDKILHSASDFKYVMLPRATSTPLFLRYSEGMHYAFHNDFYIMDSNLRSDYSVSISLSDPSEYEGGELVLRLGNSEDQEIISKLPAGKGIVYPTGTLHKVNPVTSGERRVIVFWVESIIHDRRIREILSQYSETLLRYGSGLKKYMGELEKTRFQLIRDYAQL